MNPWMLGFVVFLLTVAFNPQVAPAAAPYSIICSARGTLGTSKFVMHVRDPDWWPELRNPIISMASPVSGEMSIMEYSDLQIIAYIPAQPPGLPRGILTIVMRRDTGMSSFYFTKHKGDVFKEIFWVMTEDEIAPSDTGVCERVENKF